MSVERGVRATLRAMLSENLGLKIISLFCALAIYAFIHGAENAQRTFSVSVVSLMPPDSANRVLLTPLPTEVGVTLRGSHTQLDDLRADDVGALRLDLRSGRDTRIDLDPSMFHVPPGLTIEQIIPASIKLRWDDVVDRPIPVQVPRTGEPAPGFVVKATTSSPSTVVARGPRSVVDVVQYARAAPFDVTGLTEGSHTHPLALDTPPSMVAYSVDTVNATVEIARELRTRQFTNLKVEVVGLPHAKVKPPTVEVDVVGTAEDINGILPEAIVPHVDPKDGITGDLPKTGSAMLDVQVDVPHVKTEVKPDKVLVTW
ncbi:MAG TPA: CdaR family protein [Minicystis sp.]|nr:CdaR family protein [Minicystis sp.]